MSAEAITGYELEGPDLAERFNALSSDEILAPVVDLVPDRPCSVLDIGAGAGRDAAWFAGRGHQVVAVEPARNLREGGLRLVASDRIEWMDDRLPALTHVLALGRRFDLVTLIAVWQHLEAPERGRAAHSIAQLVAPGGLVMLSVRHGPGVEMRPCYPSTAEEVIGLFEGEGLTTVRRRTMPSVQPTNRARGVMWSWLAFAAASSTG